LAADGHLAWANPLRSLATDAAAVTDLVNNLDGPWSSPATPTATRS
jgi:hypothetical protein